MKLSIIIFFFITFRAECQDFNAIVKKLKEVHHTDQKYRIIIDSLVMKKKLLWNAPEIQNIIPLAARQDSINYTIVSSILNEYGWLGKDKIGDTASEAIFLVIQHSETDTIIKYFPLLVKGYELNKVDGKYYALMLDRILVDKNQKQIFGTQMQMPDAKGISKPFPYEGTLQQTKERLKRVSNRKS